jgi:hypothetical protein
MWCSYALQVMWPRLLEFTSATEYKMHEKKSEDETDPEAVKLDNDNVQHINWLMLRATERGEGFGIKGRHQFTHSRPNSQRLTTHVMSCHVMS